MSAWGREDNIIMTANLLFVRGSTKVTNSHGNIGVAGSFSFASNAYGDVSRSKGIEPGDYIVLHPSQAVDVGKIGDSPKYQVANVAVEAANVIHLTSPVSFTANVVHPSVQQGPKYIANIASGTARVNRGNIGANPGTRNVYSIQRVYGIDKNQANVAENKHVKNIKTPGWVHMSTHLDRSGATRHKTEQLVAMSKNGIDHNFDYPSEIHKFNISFTFQPKDSAAAVPTASAGAIANVAGANVKLIANATSVPEGAVLTYKWLHKVSNLASNTSFIDVGAGAHGAAGISGQTSNILFVANVTHVSGQVFICHASTTNEFGVIGVGNSLPVTVLQTS